MAYIMIYSGLLCVIIGFFLGKKNRARRLDRFGKTTVIIVDSKKEGNSESLSIQYIGDDMNSFAKRGLAESVLADLGIHININNRK